MKYLTNILRFLVGTIFIISGFVKTVDPIGFSYKLEEYFAPEVLNMPYFMDYVLEMSTFFVIAEVILGVLLILGIWKRFTIVSIFLLIVFFTFLTFYSAYYNVVQDCGCFGDFVKLKPWNSFTKDVVLLICIIIIWIGIKYIHPLFSKKTSYIILACSVLLMIWTAYQGISHSPLIDFRAYAEGKDLKQGMKTASELGLPEPEYQTIYTLTNLKTGDIKEVNDKEYVDTGIWEDTLNWKLNPDNIKQKMVKEGYEPPIKNFTFSCGDIDKTEQYLNENQLITVIIPKYAKADKEGIQKIINLYGEINNTVPMVVISDEPNPIKGLESISCVMDATTLKTIVRSNPGIMLLKKGVVISKYHHHDIPPANELVKDFK